MTPLIPIVDRYQSSWSEDGSHPVATYVALREACARSWDFDAHFQCCSLPSTPARLSTDALKLQPTMVAVAFDFDGPLHEFTSRYKKANAKRKKENRAPLPIPAEELAASIAEHEAWWNGECSKLQKLAAAHPGAIIYRTGGGYRVVWELATPLLLATPAEGRKWSASYSAWRVMLETAFGIKPDPAPVLASPVALFRLPLVVRDGIPAVTQVYSSEGAWDVAYVEVPAAAEPRIAGSVKVPCLAAEVSDENVAVCIELLGSRWPGDEGSGRGRPCFWALSNVLIRAGWDDEDIGELMFAIAERRSNSFVSLEDRTEIARYCRRGQDLRQGGYGYPHLISELGKGAVDELVRLLDLDGEAARGADVGNLVSEIERSMLEGHLQARSAELERVLRLIHAGRAAT